MRVSFSRPSSRDPLTPGSQIMRAMLVAMATALLIFVMVPAIAPHQSTPSAQRRGATAPAPDPAGGPAGQQGRRGFGRANTPTFPGPPAGMQALTTDLFTSKNFYKDKALWSDKRYFRCNTPRQITDIWTSGRVKNAQSGAPSWGDCNIDYPRDQIVSAYPYKTAREH